jgi:glycosyltransferase involved in cell wall biosynthesis
MTDRRWQYDSMRIVVDATPLALPRTGIGNYLRGMLGGLAEMANGRHELVAFAATGLPGRRHVEASLRDFALERRLLLLPLARAWRAGWNRVGWPPVERASGPLDVFHFSDWMYPPQTRGVRATTIHDLVPLRFPGLVHPRTVRMHTAKYRNAAATCDLVFANSRFTADDVAERLGVAPERIRVAYPGVDPRFEPEGPRANLGAPYVLAVSTLEPRKNLARVLEAFALLRRTRPQLELAVVGEVARGQRVPAVVEHVRLLGYVSDEYLAALYRGASVFVYLSSFEGFGIPVVEALASGVPAVTSAHPSLDEAAGTAAYRADPMDPEAVSAALERALDHGTERRDPGREHARRFTWRACGEAVLRGYESAL